MNVKLRGIYATALTGLFLDQGWEVVQPSVSIRERFDEEFSFGEPVVDVRMTSDREGILVTGSPGGVDSAVDMISGVGMDTVVWDAGLSRGAVQEGAVIDTTDSGAIVACEPEEVFLPFDEAESFLSEGDSVTIQVIVPRPPWSNHRSIASTRRVVFGGLARLEQSEGGQELMYRTKMMRMPSFGKLSYYRSIFRLVGGFAGSRRRLMLDWKRKPMR